MHVFGSGQASDDSSSRHSSEQGAGPSLVSFSPDERPRRSRKRKKRMVHEGDEGPAEPAQDSFDRIIVLCAVRDRSEKELRDRLLRDGYDPTKAEEALQRAIECGLVDNQRFADGFIRARIHAGKGEVVIRRDLEKHGISADDIPGWPDEYLLSFDEQVQRAVNILKSSPPRSKDPYQAAFRKLVSRGYSKAVTTQAVRTWHQSL